MNRLRNVVCGIVCFFLSLSLTVTAADKLQIIQSFTGEDYIALYVRGLVSEENISEVEIGREIGKAERPLTLENAQVPIRTLVMIDNSISIRETDREKIREIVQYLIVNRKTEEQIAIATFDETLHYLSTYTIDDDELKKELEELKYQDQETYMTDVLCELLENGLEIQSEECFDRILLISDGMDNKSIGYTKEELFSDIEKKAIPIYTVGCAGKNNEEALENMFALSRRSNAESILLDEIDDTLQIAELLAKDRDLTRIKIVLPEEALDGSRKVVKLNIGKDTLQYEIRMPQSVVEKDESISEITERDTETQEDSLETNRSFEEEQSSQRANIVLVTGITIGSLALVGLTLIGIWLFLRKKRSEEDEEPVSVINNERTIVSGNCTLSLEDISNPVRTYQVDFDALKPLTIGRDETLGCDICIPFDKGISGRHCEIGMDEDGVYILDLHSTNGTFINGSRIIDRVRLIDGNKLRIGKTEFRVMLRSSSMTMFGDDSRKTMMI